MNKLLLVIMAAVVLAGCHDKKAPIPDNEPTPLINTEGEVTIAGSPVTGQTLTANVTDFNGISGPISYQWAADGAAIAGATANTFVPTAAEVGAALTVTADYTDDEGFAESVTSDPTGPVTIPPNDVGQAMITGVPTVDEVLTADVTDGNGTTSSTFAYQWLADGADIAGATAVTYTLTNAELGALITVNVTYTDDDGYAEDITSPSIGPVSAAAVNVPGSVAISGTLVVGDDLTATVTDANGATGPINYQWAADGVDIGGATAGTYTVTGAELGTVISVTVEYTDDAGFAEGPHSDTAIDIIYSYIVVGETTLQAAAAAAVDGDIIGLASPSGDDYIAMAEVEFTANDLRIQRTASSTAEITGTTCIVFSGDNNLVDGLVFDGLDWIGGGTCDSNGDASVLIRGDGTTLSNSEFRGEAFPRTVPSGDPYHYIAIRGVGNVIERNLSLIHI